MGTTNQKRTITKRKETSLSSSLASDKPGALVKHLNKLSLKKAVEVRNQERDMNAKLESLHKKYKEYEELDIAKRDEILEGISKEITQVEQQLAELPDYKTLRELKHQSEDRAIRELTLLQLWLADQFNINNNLNKTQIESASYMILEEFPGLYLEEIGISFKNLLNGQYGEVYRLDTNTLLKCIRQYKKDKAQLVMEQHQSNHASSKGDSMEERVAEKLNKAEMAKAREWQAQQNEKKQPGNQVNIMNQNQ